MNIKVPALQYSIQVFLDHAYQHACLRVGILQQNLERRNEAVKKFTKMVDDSVFAIRSENSSKLFWANIFSSAFIVDSFVYGGAYVLYMYIEKKLDSTPRRIIVAFLGISAVLLLFTMVLMNFQVL